MQKTNNGLKFCFRATGNRPNTSEKVAEIDVDISSIRLEVSQIGGYNIISNPIGRFGTLDWTKFPRIRSILKRYVNAPL